MLSHGSLNWQFYLDGMPQTHVVKTLGGYLFLYLPHELGPASQSAQAGLECYLLKG
jgi:hypothetical protein